MGVDLRLVLVVLVQTMLRFNIHLVFPSSTLVLFKKIEPFLFTQHTIQSRDYNIIYQFLARSFWSKLFTYEFEIDENYNHLIIAYDNFEYTSKWIDPGFKAAGTVTSIVGGFLIKLGESGKSLQTDST